MKNYEDDLRRKVWTRQKGWKEKRIRRKHLGKMWEILQSDKTCTYFNKIFHKKSCFHQEVVIWHGNWLEHPHILFSQKKPFHLKARVFCPFSWNPEYNSITKPQSQRTPQSLLPSCAQVLKAVWQDYQYLTHHTEPCNVWVTMGLSSSKSKDGNPWNTRHYSKGCYTEMMVLTLSVADS